MVYVMIRPSLLNGTGNGLTFATTGQDETEERELFAFLIACRGAKLF